MGLSRGYILLCADCCAAIPGAGAGMIRCLEYDVVVGIFQEIC